MEEKGPQRDRNIQLRVQESSNAGRLRLTDKSNLSWQTVHQSHHSSSSEVQQPSSGGHWRCHHRSSPPLS
ncbi:hypothetical protein OIU79_013801 [Salix purpurea]|uniref:Uncharacterized protein n=1 Tax=Salix purpurea TaxID=77065 RepID=A0A9Q0SWQ1_SALPP|nr:hypothetical protein OIU79_013801 [Salix purpurea]